MPVRGFRLDVLLRKHSSNSSVMSNLPVHTRCTAVSLEERAGIFPVFAPELYRVILEAEARCPFLCVLELGDYSMSTMAGGIYSGREQKYLRDV